MAESVRVDRLTLTKQQLRATEIVLYRMADLVNRLLADGTPYTKIEVNTPSLPLQAPQGIAGQMAPVPTPLASSIVPGG